jgi:hypothetical protein
MRNIHKGLIFIPLILLGILLSCDPAGQTEIIMDGDLVNRNLPEELKGLKIYKVCTGNDTYVKVAVLDGKLNSITYPESKTYLTSITLTKVEAVDNYSIPIIEIISETDSIIVARKK